MRVRVGGHCYLNTREGGSWLRVTDLFSYCPRNNEEEELWTIKIGFMRHYTRNDSSMVEAISS